MFSLSATEHAGHFTDIRVIRNTLSFSIQTVAPAQEWALETATHPQGPWQPLPELGPPFPYRVRLPMDAPERYFRIVWGERTSRNLAGYRRLTAPQGSSMIAHPFVQGHNTLEELFPDVPEGTRLYKYSAVRQTYASISQLQFGAWDQPRVTLASGEGAYLHLLNPLELVLAGSVEPLPPPSFEGGWNMVSCPLLPSASWPSPLDGDQLLRARNGTFVSHHAQNGEWTPPLPALSTGESFWYYRNEANPSAEPAAATVYLNNYVPGLVHFVVYGWPACAVQAPWRIQLWAGTNPSNVVPVTEALSPGPTPGHLDTRQGGVLRIPSLAPGATAYLQGRTWDGSTGADYATASVRGESSLVQVRTGGAGSPPSVPAPLAGLQSFALLGGFAFCSQPAGQLVAAGASAVFTTSASAAPPALPPPQFQWQRKLNADDWEEIPGAISNTLVLEPVSVQDAGEYRVVMEFGQQQWISESAQLTVVAAPSVTFPRLGDSSFAVSLHPLPGFTQVIEISSDLKLWFEWQTFADLTEPIEISIPKSDQTSRRYLRVRVE